MGFFDIFKKKDEDVMVSQPIESNPDSPPNMPEDDDFTFDKPQTGPMNPNAKPSSQSLSSPNSAGQSQPQFEIPDFDDDLDIDLGIDEFMPPDKSSEVSKSDDVEEDSDGELDIRPGVEIESGADTDLVVPVTSKKKDDKSKKSLPPKIPDKSKIKKGDYKLPSFSTSKATLKKPVVKEFKNVSRDDLLSDDTTKRRAVFAHSVEYKQLLSSEQAILAAMESDFKNLDKILNLMKKENGYFDEISVDITDIHRRLMFIDSMIFEEGELQ